MGRHGSAPRRARGARRRRGPVLLGVAVVLALVGLLAVGRATALGPARASADASGTEAPAVVAPGPMVLAYYYLWFNPTSWNRAKIDYPLVGRYSSDESRIMRQHITWAQEAGIDGFLVSWKSTSDLDERLDKLATVARAEGFRLGIVYQGLDFNRDPLPAPRIAADLQLLADRYADDSAFRIKDKPIVALSGSWRFSPEQLRSIAAPVQDRLLVLGMEKDVEGVHRVADVLDGDAYYWSSMDASSPAPERKLQEMADAVHRTGGLWIAPVAPGYDARLIGGDRVIERAGGEALRDSWRAAVRSDPDLLGLISWNEFSENTHVEPSDLHGYTSLDVVADLQGTPTPTSRSFDSSEPGGRVGPWRSVVTFGAMGAMIAGCFLAVRVRNRRDRPGMQAFRT